MIKKNMVLGGIILSIAFLGTSQIDAKKDDCTKGKHGAAPAVCYLSKQAVKSALLLPLVYYSFVLSDKYFSGKDPLSETKKLCLKSIVGGVLIKAYDDTWKAIGKAVDSGLESLIAPAAHSVCGVKAAN